MVPLEHEWTARLFVTGHVGPGRAVNLDVFVNYFTVPDYFDESGVAELVAVFDAMMQGPDGEWTANSVIEPLKRAQDQRQTKIRSKAARTRVEFFTMVRGDSF